MTSAATPHEPSRRPFAELRFDAPASVVVALVALPLCLGIAVGSNAPPLAGLVTGIVGGLFVAFISGASLAVSGPAAGLTAIVLAGIADLGYEGFILAVAFSGVIQLVMGFAGLGIFGYYIPSSVIRGMLAAIGIILILKQIPHALGFDADYEGDLSFAQADGRNTFTEIPYALGHMHLGATLIAVSCLAVLLIVPRIPSLARIRLLPAPLLAVVLGMVMNLVFGAVAPQLAVHGDLLVKIPDLSGPSSLLVATPDFSRITDGAIWWTAVVIALVASLETLLCVEAVDKLDPFKRNTPANRELKAQGVGNFVAGLMGGIPMTAVIVRGSANVHAGGRTPTSAFLHGLWLLLALFLIPGVLNAIPLAALAAVLLDVGYKLAPIRLFRQMWTHGYQQFFPFLVTVVAILWTDLLVGVAIGLVVAIFFILMANLTTAYFLHDEMEVREDGTNDLSINMVLSENVSFLNKAAVNKALHDIPEGARVRIDGSNSRHIDHDVIELIREFRDALAPSRDIQVELVGIPDVGSLSPH